MMVESSFEAADSERGATEKQNPKAWLSPREPPLRQTWVAECLQETLQRRKSSKSRLLSYLFEMIAAKRVKNPRLMSAHAD